ncbi:MAG TPA: alpha-amylase family glycosyl hydrolase [Gemmatimonadaceae bacterium]|jgi:glycosidase
MTSISHRALRATLCALLVAIAGTARAQTAVPHPQWARKAVLYEINVRQYTPEGTFAALDRWLPHLDSLGVDVLWLMPVQPIGKLNRKGPLGSYYSISNYRAINPEFGTAAGLSKFISDAHRHGKKVVLDWVPNHTSFDHVWITQHPDWYVHRPDGSISNARDNENHETDWTDVAELDYGKPAMRRAMIADMRWWLDSMHVDGFRCDVAGGVPMDFWRDARRELTAVRPDLYMLAEAEGPQFYSAFDATYGWELHHMLNEIAQGKRPTADLDAYLARQRKDYPAGAERMYFTSNHDENSWSGTEFERMGANHLPAFILAATMQDGIPLIYTGQEASLRKRLRFFEKDTVDWTGPSLVAFYRAVIDLKHANASLWNGADGGEEVKLETDGGSRVYAFTRTKGDNTVLVAVNFGDAPARIGYRSLARPGNYTDWFSKTKVNLAALGALDVPANGYRVLVR